ncbi:MAG: formylglycine-generating enzyme family protein [Myxococcota bacterium]|nr:formylglycine-generating enzyme family protein [Myxococcota bacterium]
MFFRTYHDQQGGSIPTADPATVSDFRLDNYAVTVGRFRRFVAATIAGLPPPAARAGIHTHLNGGMGLENSANPGTFEAGWDPAWTIPTTATDWGAELTSQCDSTGQYPTWTATSGANENRPINCVNWYEAYAFCIWDGGFLPSATETEYAAAGGTSQRKYPWGTTDPGGLTSIGSTIDPSQAIRYAIFGDDSGNCFYPTGTTAPCTGSANIAPVGTATLGVGRWGQFDLAGNVGAWSLDWDHFPLANPCVNCANLTMPTVGAAARTGEDGYYAGPPSWLHPRVGGGGGFPSQHNSGAGGVRCARTP